jgi:DNA-binding beta-propeller fold protein YncE
VVVLAATVPGAIRGSGPAGRHPAASTAYIVYVEIFGPPEGRDGPVPVSTATRKPGKPIRIPGMIGAAITPDGKTIYAGAGDTVIPVSTATNKPGRPIRFRGRVSAIAMSPAGKTAYVQVNPRRHGSAAELVPVSTATNTPGQPIRVGTEMGVVAFTPDGKTAYAGGTDTVTPINTATSTPGQPIPLRGPINAVAILITRSPASCGNC